MQTRHRIPTLFNLSMVDVLCCALGCIMLLWLVYFREAKERAQAAGKSGEALADTRGKLARVSDQLTATQQALLAEKRDLKYLQAQLHKVTAHRDHLAARLDVNDKDLIATQQYLKTSKDRIVGLEADLDKYKGLQTAATALLAQRARENNRLTNQVVAAGIRIRDLEKLAGDQKDRLNFAAIHAIELKDQIRLTREQVARLEQLLAGMTTTSKDTAEQLAAAEARAALMQMDLDKRKKDVAESNRRVDDLLALKQLLEESLGATRADLAKAKKELAETQLAVHGLSGENKVLNKRLLDYKAAADNRFAGIELTGEKVLFIVDMSGSMGLKDDDTPDPNKWPLLCEILGKIMQSLPDLKQFQVILFSDKVRYPLGNNGKWIEYRGIDSVKEAVKGVLAVKPNGGTNMSMVFEEAFRYRATGLDTIYFLSDGLPNDGDGLPPGAAKMTESERGIHLGKYIRNRMKTTWNAPQGAAKQRVRINTVGFYFDSPDVGAFLWALARDNDGGFVGLSKP